VLPRGAVGRPAVVLAAILSTAALLILPIVPAAAEVPAGPLLGICVHGTDPTRVPAIAQAGFTVVRTDLIWWQVVKPGGRRDWSKYDAWVAALRAHRLIPLLILRYEHAGVPAPVLTEEDREEFAEFAAAAARRYPGALWEVWNEPNVERFWPHPDADTYVQMLAAVSAAIRAADPGARVLGGSVGGPTFDLPFLRTAIAAGLLDHADMVAVHPYAAARPEEAAAFYRAVAALMPRGRERGLAVSEWGYTSTRPGSEADQADKLVRALNTNLKEGIVLTVWYEWQDGGDDPGDPEHGFGLLRRDGSPKPSYEALQDLRRGR
jgi:polysaccharide biosynthesis protein PslG